MTHTQAWQELKEHHRQISTKHMRDLFSQDPQRFERLSLSFEDLLFDYSKNRITDHTLRLLCALAGQCGLEDKIGRMFAGERINCTEQRPALHVALRNRSSRPIHVDGEDIMPRVHAVLDQMRAFVDKVHSGAWRGFTGEPICDVVNIGIGGSDLGPRMAVQALTPYHKPGIKVHFVSNIDPADLADTLAVLRPETTIFLIASKTFGTQETLANAHGARDWFLQAAGETKHVARHFVALSTNRERVRDFGIDPANMFPFWDWVGGRYSLWSAIGLSIALAAGMDRFEELLAGGHAMDEHFRSAPLDRNLPVVMGLLGIWYVNFFGAATQAIVPYAQHLQRLPAYLQQADMESNGKATTCDGRAVCCDTGPVVWGEPGTNGQHAFFQLLHQGTRLIPVDFLVPMHSHYAPGEHHNILLANCLAQCEALMRGRTDAEARIQMEAQGLDQADISRLAPHRVFPGNRPSNLLMFDKLTPRILGILIALYEHKIYVQGTLWGINSFDQWGVELGKQLAGTILTELQEDGALSEHDASTAGLIRHARRNL
ncbi:MAG: glucose-6-phosphate isomerase [Desulfuromonadales bacterium]|nr:glucose-6-phosphate isomerase [Desulfuromonadales bacterium]